MRDPVVEFNPALLLHHLQAGVIIHDPDLRVRSANRPACDLLGLTLEQLSGREVMDPVWAFLREDGSPMPLEEYPVNRVLTSGELRGLTMGVRRPPSGDVVWAKINAYAEHDGDGHLERIVVTFIDVTGRTLAEAHNRHITQVLRAVRNVNQLIVREKDRDRLLTLACELLTETRGYRAAWICLRDATGDQMISFESGAGPTFGTGHARMDRGTWTPCATKALSTNDPIVRRCRTPECGDCPLAADHENLAVLAGPIGHEGLVHGALVVSLPVEMADDEEEQSLFREVSGDLGLALFLMRKEHESTLAQAALRESEAKFRTLVESSPDGIYIQTGGCLRYLNPAMAEIFGAADPTALLGTPVVERFAPGDRPLVDERIRLLNEDRRSVDRRELKVLRPDGTLLDAEFSGVPFVHDGLDGALVFARDISLRKRNSDEREKLRLQLARAQKLEAVGRLAGGVAHDFNNMLGVILGTGELMLEQVPEGSALREDLEAILTAARRSADITRQLLAFSRKQTIAPRAMDLNAAVQDLLKMLRRLLGEDVDLAWMPAPGLWNVKLDPSQLDQLLANLCVNARDAIAGVGRITIESANVTFDEAYCENHFGFTPGDFVMLGVSDDGCGMSPEVLEHIYEPFFTTKKAGEGTGLGMATVYGIVNQNEGFINVYSEPGSGTTFRIYLPRHHGPARDHLPGPEGTIPAGRGEWVLVVEDEVSILKMASSMLQRLGYRVLPAGSPAEALQVAGDHAGSLDLLLTDVVMPGMNGRDLSAALVRRFPHLRTLFMSGYTANVIAHRGMLDEGIHFLQKPFSKQDLAVRLREVLDDPNPRG
ncbi:PAS domain S-box protein [Myxococcota bacterium]|nr:PAS domain S-box protein [Myxococcota bacterium]MBU1509260.1 PAS domain S-box protein [Myxococcota bacterium]